ncbi:DUF3052 domain-containing protein [Streptomyces sp. NPDC094468]|uniref:DUF3052 domain-containing protein n=1 Tax=Streptomyces sp. NPDC094468 TaxID=3366066 RepID=UPI0037F3269E
MTTEERASVAVRLGFQPGQVVQEINYGDDVDQELREAIAELIGQGLVGEEHDDVPDVILLWFRDEDGDLTDALVDAIGMLAEGGGTWLLTPRAGRDGYLESSEIIQASQTAGLTQGKSFNVAKDWTGTRLTAQKR